MCCACGGGNREDEDAVDEIDCMCMCDATNIDCWRDCFECLDDIFDEPTIEPEPVGYACEECCNECTFEDIECWEKCHECLDPYFGDDAYGLNATPIKSKSYKA